MTSMTEFYGEPISVYTDEQAIEDGQLVMVDETLFPGCLFTQAVMTVIMDKVEKGQRTYLQIVAPLMQDVMMIARKHPTEPEYTGNELDGNVTGKTLWFGMNQSGGITVMFPEDR